MEMNTQHEKKQMANKRERERKKNRPAKTNNNIDFMRKQYKTLMKKE